MQSMRTGATMDQISILMLEDSSLDAELILAKLKKENIGYQADRAKTEDEFRQSLKNRTFDVILSDFSIPEFPGMEALKVAKEIQPDIPFIFVSGTLGEEVAIETLKQGATDYVLKHKLERL